MNFALTASMLASFALLVLLAVAGWLRTLEAFAVRKSVGTRIAAGWLCFSLVHTAAAVAAWYALAFLVHPFR